MSPDKAAISTGNMNALSRHYAAAASVSRTPGEYQNRIEENGKPSGMSGEASPQQRLNATESICRDAQATPTPPHRYGLRAHRASRGSFSTPSRRNRKLPPTTNETSRLNALTPHTTPTPPPRYGTVTCDSRNINSSRRASIGRTLFGTMASATGKWREEQILIICPGSRTTMAQLGCSELTPPTHKIPTRMFKDGDEWRPYHTYKRTSVVNGVEVDEWVEDVDEDKDAVWPIKGGRIIQMDAFLAFLDHVHGMLTTTYHNTPIMLMSSPQWTRPDCETIARYIFEKTKTPALCIIHSGIATQYGLKWPNMTVIDIGYEKVDVTAIHDGRVVNHMDLGGASHPERQISGGEVFTSKLLKLLEGRGFNHDMAEQLKKSTICEVLPYAPTEKQLVNLPVETAASQQPVTAAHKPEPSREIPKINEPPKIAIDGTEEDDPMETTVDDEGVLDVAAIVTSGQTKEFLAKKDEEKEKGRRGRKPKDKDAEAAQAKPVRLPNSKKVRNTFFYDEIVQEAIPPEPKQPLKAPEPAPPSTSIPAAAPQENGTGNAAILVTAAEPVPVPAPETKENTETTDEKPATHSEAGVEIKTESGAPPPTGDAAPIPPTSETLKSEEANANGGELTTAPETIAAPAHTTNPAAAPATAAAKEPEVAVVESSNDTIEFRPKRIRKDIEVGLERFLFADRNEIDRIVSTIYRTIQGIDDMYMRPACWDNLVFVGNGSRLRGLKENVLQTLQARHIISPSTATMFTSELPSNMATPTGTGSQTPTGSFTGAPHQLSSSGVNPLLQAATTASTFGAGGPMAAAVTPQAGSEVAGPASSHHFHSQTPTSIKTVTLPTYLSEWTKNGFEEAMFLGAQVAARIAFCLHSNMDAQAVEAQRMMSLSRVEYNELGPKAIRTHSMLS